MATRRVDVTVSSPSTEFYTDADQVSQSQSGNYSTVNYWVGATNRGGTTSFDANNGAQTATIAGSGGAGHGGTIPSGVSVGVQRWYDGPWGLNLGHDSAGNRGADTVAQTITWSWGQTNTGSIGPYTRIPKPPTLPGTPVASNLLPTSVKLTWTASTNNNGSAITGYLVRRWLGSARTGTYTDVVTLNALTYTDTSLTPGTTYSYGIYAKNGSYGVYSPISGNLTIKTIAPAHVRVAGVWHYATPYVKVAGVWKVSQPWVRVGGVWKATT